MNPVRSKESKIPADSQEANRTSNGMNFGGLKVLMISSDRNVLTPGSAVSERMKEYGALVEELHIVVLCDKSHTSPLKIENGKLKISDSVFIYPTNSSNKFFRPIDAASIGKRIVFKNKFVRGLSLVTTQDPFECGWAGLKVKRKWRIPLEVQLHTNPFSTNFSGFLNFIRRRIAKKVLKKADSIRVVSENLKHNIENLLKIASPRRSIGEGQGNWKLKILPIYVDKNKIENGQITFDVHARYPWHFIILCVARLETEKNLSLALRILTDVRKVYPDIGLLVVGSGSQEKALKSQAKSLGLEGAVEFAGWQEDLSSFYKTSNLFLQTSLFEGYGLALVEAGLSGLPVVSTPVGIAVELEHGKDAYIYPASSPELFAQGIIDLIENNQKRENLKINLKHTLDAKLISKEDYLTRLKENWEETSKRIK